MLQGPLESSDIRRAKAELSASFYEENPVRTLILDRADRVCCAVRRTVVDYQYMIVALNVRHCGNYLLNVFNFIVGRDYYEFFLHTESIYVDTNLVFFV